MRKTFFYNSKTKSDKNSPPGTRMEHHIFSYLLFDTDDERLVFFFSFFSFFLFFLKNFVSEDGELKKE